MAARFGSAPIWSSERKKVFARLWTGGAIIAEIIHTLNALPGRPFTKRTQLNDKAKLLGIRRPDWYIGEAHKVDAIRLNKSRVPTQPKPPPRGPVKARHRTPIKAPLHVLYNQGFQLWQDGFLAVNERHDIEAINKAKKKAEPGHPGFQLYTH